MPTLLLRFPGGRYHATPWGHHVNEGLVEWPPSPWRVLRALLSVGYTRLGWPAELNEPWKSRPPETACALLAKLAATLPRYGLPLASAAHSRHYMPVAAFKGDRENTTLVFDTWARIESGELSIRWDVELTVDETTLLATLAEQLGYLGRSESWVVARLATDAETAGLRIDAWPDVGTAPPGPGWEQVALLAATPPSDYTAWREARVTEALAELPALALPDKKKPTAKDRKPIEARDAERARAQAAYPADALACLQTDTTWQRAHGWSQPPGSRRVLYRRRADALRSAPLAARVATTPRVETTRVPFVLLSLTSASGNDHALPTLARSLPQGELLHETMVSQRTKLVPGAPAPTLTGCDAERRPLRGRHGHAHVLSLDLDRDGHIDHLLVWAPDGLDADDQLALRRSRRTYTKGGVGELRLSWAASGDRDDLARLDGRPGDALRATLGPGRHWLSATPFVPPRFLKAQGRNGWQGQIRDELAARGLPAPSALELLDPKGDPRARAMRHHVRLRRGTRPQPPVNVGLVVRMTFDVAVSGPICLGYSSHFGLGRFERTDPA